MTEHTKSSVYLSIGFTILGFAIFCGADLGAKILSQSYSIPELFFYNGVVGIVIMSVFGWCYQGRRAFQTQNFWKHCLRVVFTMAVAGLNIYALSQIPLVTFYALIFTGPLWVKILASLVLKEPFGIRRLMAVLIGFMAVLYMLQPDAGTDFTLGHMAALISPIFFAGGMMVVRKIGRGEPPSLYGLFSMCGLLLVSLPFVVTDLHLPALADVIPLILYGACVGGGIVFTVLGFQMAPASATVAPFNYTQMIWGALLDYFVFDSIPEIHTMIGAGILVAMGIYLIRTEASAYART